MKYIRKTPVDAIQWTGHNLEEIHEFIVYVVKYCYSKVDESGSLIIVYKDHRDRTFKTIIPELGWIVRVGKTFQYYKNETFHSNFEKVPDDGYKGIGMSKIIQDNFGRFDEMSKEFKNVFGVDPLKETLDAIKIRESINPDGRLTKLIDDLYKDDEKTREEIKKNMAEGLKEMEDSDKAKGTESDTFESVLDEMKELHAKKNACYGDAAHKNFLKYGPVASLSRLSEKMQRAEHILLSGKCEVKDEPLTETLIDMAITSAMLYMELKNKEND